MARYLAIARGKHLDLHFNESRPNVSWLIHLTDRLVLQPTTHPILETTLIRESIVAPDGELEIWTSSFRPQSTSSKKVLWIKFPGTGGRAERSSNRPAHLWPDCDSVVWVVNPFGYGSSCGQATLQRFPEMIDLVVQAAKDRYPERELVVSGTSLGSISALSLAANHPVAGVLLRNPVPIHQLISRRWRYAIPSLGLSRVVAAQIPESLNAIANAGRCHAPLVVVSAQQDSVVPVRFQNQIIESYAGPKRILPLPNQDHADPIPGNLTADYIDAIEWLGQQVAPAQVAC